MTRLLVADDHPMIRSAIDMLLRGSEFEVVGWVGTGAEALRKVEEVDPDIVMLDIQMPDGSGIEVLRKLRSQGDRRPVVLLTAAIEDSALLTALALKVEGIVLKNSEPGYLVDCLETVRGGGRWIDPDVDDRGQALAKAAKKGPALTPRERELVALVRKGLRNRDIAAQLGVTEGTVKVYLHGLFDRLGINNRTELAIRADELLGGAPAAG